MIGLSLLIVLTVVLFGAAWVVVRGQAAEIKQLSELISRGHPVDVIAFMNLVSRDEDDYLREQLPAREYRQIKRLRITAALEYMRSVRHNASLLIRLGESMRTSPDPELSQQAARVLMGALQMRVLALAVTAKLAVAYTFPALDISSGSMIHSYEELTGQLSSLCRLKQPQQAGRILASM